MTQIDEFGLEALKDNISKAHKLRKLTIKTAPQASVSGEFHLSKAIQEMQKLPNLQELEISSDFKLDFSNFSSKKLKKLTISGKNSDQINFEDFAQFIKNNPQLEMVELSFEDKTRPLPKDIKFLVEAINSSNLRYIKTSFGLGGEGIGNPCLEFFDNPNHGILPMASLLKDITDYMLMPSIKKTLQEDGIWQEFEDMDNLQALEDAIFSAVRKIILKNYSKEQLGEILEKHKEGSFQKQKDHIKSNSMEWESLFEDKKFKIPEGVAQKKGLNIEIITNGAELKEVGKTMKNCLRGTNYISKCYNREAHIAVIKNDAGDIISAVAFALKSPGSIMILSHEGLNKERPDDTACLVANYFVKEVNSQNIKINEKATLLAPETPEQEEFIANNRFRRNMTKLFAKIFTPYVIDSFKSIKTINPCLAGFDDEIAVDLRDKKTNEEIIKNLRTAIANLRFDPHKNMRYLPRPCLPRQSLKPVEGVEAGGRNLQQKL